MMMSERTAGFQAFVRTVETGSFSAAARLAGTTPSAVSKSVERLERRLGVKLFLRSTRSLALTIDGTAYYERVAPLLRALDDADEALAETGKARGKLRVSIPGILGPTIVDELTRNFLSRFPEIQLEVSVTDRHIDLVREGFDVALRAGPVEDRDWIMRPLGDFPLVLVAAPGYVANSGALATPDDLAVAAHIRYRLRSQVYPIRFADGSHLLPNGVFDTDSGQAMRIAALNGIGIAQLLRVAVADDLAAGRLVEIMRNVPLATVPLQALHAFGRFAPLRLRLFTDFLVETLAQRQI